MLVGIDGRNDVAELCEKIRIANTIQAVRLDEP